MWLAPFLPSTAPQLPQFRMSLPERSDAACRLTDFLGFANSFLSPFFPNLGSQKINVKLKSEYRILKLETNPNNKKIKS
jgi:hypothetical protein